MAIFITGDIHGSHSIRKLGRKKFDSDGLTRDDCVIILGDFGLVWHDPPAGEERYWLDWLEGKPWTTLFVDGNHENHDMLAAMPAGEWRGGRVHAVRDHVLHLMRGEVFDIDGRTFFAMGGAHSTDKEWRTPYRTWWPNEAPSSEERERAARKVAEVAEVDYVVTHCPPADGLRALAPDSAEPPGQADEYMEWLQREVAGRLSFKRWFYGHMHEDRPQSAPYTPLYGCVFDLDGTGRTPYGPGAGHGGPSSGLDEGLC